MSDEIGEALDAGAPGFGAPVADLFVRDQEVINDDINMIQVNELRYEITIPLTQATIECRVGANLGRTFEFLNVKNL